MSRYRLAELTAFKKECHDKVSQIHNRVAVLTELQREEYAKAEAINRQWDAVEKEYYALKEQYAELFGKQKQKQNAV
jgi:hypothetical protein